MKARFFVPVLSVFVILACGAVLAVFWIFPYLSSPDAGMAAAAEFALSHTPMDRVSRVRQFTGGELQSVVSGTDAFGRRLYAIVTGNRAVVIYKNQVAPASKVESEIRALGLPVTGILSVVPGLVNPGMPQGAASLAQGGAVWEITARLKGGRYLFAYADLYTGRILYDFSTRLSPRL